MAATLGLLTALVGVVACDDSTTEPAPIPDIDGDWFFSDMVSAAFGECTAGGVATIVQSGDSFTGTIDATEGVCIWEDGGSDDNTGPVPIAAGAVTDSTVTFSAGICDFEGAFNGRDRIEGTEVCTVQAVVPTPMTGTFTLSR